MRNKTHRFILPVFSVTVIIIIHLPPQTHTNLGKQAGCTEKVALALPKKVGDTQKGHDTIPKIKPEQRKTLECLEQAVTHYNCYSIIVAFNTPTKYIYQTHSSRWLLFSLFA